MAAANHLSRWREAVAGFEAQAVVVSSDSETVTLQNAVTATNQQFDALAMKLYGLTEDDIKLVEASIPHWTRNV